MNRYSWGGHLLPTVSVQPPRGGHEVPTLRKPIGRRPLRSAYSASAASSASMNIAGTSKPACCVISWKQVGLVTLISVR
jgi:hypothetical protein